MLNPYAILYLVHIDLLFFFFKLFGERTLNSMAQFSLGMTIETRGNYEEKENQEVKETY